jgi:hypothetical protein
MALMKYKKIKYKKSITPVRFVGSVPVFSRGPTLMKNAWPLLLQILQGTAGQAG